ncbi:DUF3037 domain-containing protein [Flaviaesturariibacter aridisoli]|uniref:DUF3037 domain-containing protein n=1 Tax=Flaviaesturariibacter aridisoli TaxID=2545761 RepID=A0A4R4E0A6_9BACT|nr:DUF3037 domain-containing protein [Flaviaesturariibacter aridisoli]TCZ72799.1 DUF3037 domain-containing protein [Flaviaesturariibacter aridisoli]
MTTNIYTYSLLQYRHSQALGEVLNVGLLVYFPVSNKLHFLHPDRLARLRLAYLDVPEKTIRAYFQKFNAVIERYNKSVDLFEIKADNLDAFIKTQLLPEDASSLQFGAYRTGLFYSGSPEKILTQLYNLYFIFFSDKVQSKQRLDDQYLLRQYKQLLKNIESELGVSETDKLKFDVVIPANDSFKFRFDVGWHKDDFHLVKPLSFDLNSRESVQAKALQYFGQFTGLEHIADRNNYQFDLLIAPPSDKALFKIFDASIKLLEEPKHVQLIEQKDLQSYSLQTISAIA